MKKYMEIGYNFGPRSERVHQQESKPKDMN